MGSEAIRQAPGGGVAAVAVDEGDQPPLPEAGDEAPHVAHRQAQEPGRFRGHEGTVLELCQDLCALLLSLGQGDRLPGHDPRVTESLNC